MKTLKIFRLSTWRRAIMWSSFQLIRVTCWSLCSQKLLWESKKEDARGVPPPPQPEAPSKFRCEPWNRNFRDIFNLEDHEKKVHNQRDGSLICGGTSAKRHFPILKPRETIWPPASRCAPRWVALEQVWSGSKRSIISEKRINLRALPRILPDESVSFDFADPNHSSATKERWSVSLDFAAITSPDYLIHTVVCYQAIEFVYSCSVAVYPCTRINEIVKLLSPITSRLRCPTREMINVKRIT